MAGKRRKTARVDAERLEDLDDLVNGLHSGLPYCCIHEYLVLRRETGHPSYTQRERHGVAIPHELGYVPCTSCIHARNFVKIKPNGFMDVVGYVKGQGPELPAIKTVGSGDGGELTWVSRHLNGEPLS